MYFSDAILGKLLLNFFLWVSPWIFSCTAFSQLVQTISNQQYVDLNCPFYLSARSLILS